MLSPNVVTSYSDYNVYSRKVVGQLGAPYNNLSDCCLVSPVYCYR